MLAKSVKVADLSSGMFLVRLKDGTSATVDLRPLLLKDKYGSDIISKPDFFAKVEVRDGVIRWPNGSDLSPDKVASLVYKASGVNVLDPVAKAVVLLEQARKLPGLGASDKKRLSEAIRTLSGM